MILAPPRLSRPFQGPAEHDLEMGERVGDECLNDALLDLDGMVEFSEKVFVNGEGAFRNGISRFIRLTFLEGYRID